MKAGRPNSQGSLRVGLYEYLGSVHFHTTHSDGALTHQEIAHLAQEADLDFLIATDHNRLVLAAEGYYGPVLMLVGEEIHDFSRRPEANHYLAFGIEQELTGYTAHPQQVIDQVRALGGFGFLAHPYETAARISPEPPIPWEDWEVEGYAGLELWNYMSEFKSRVTSLPRALFLAYFPQVGICGPFPETLARWDQLLSAGRKVTVLGGTDAHGWEYTWGPLRREVLSYRFLLDTLHMHILTPQPLSGHLAHDKVLIYGALREGHSFIGYDLIADSTNFRFVGRGRREEVGMGEELAIDQGVEFVVSSPQRALLRLGRNGPMVAQAKGQSLVHSAYVRGSYRVEAYRWYLGKRRGWVFTNPIYIR